MPKFPEHFSHPSPEQQAEYLRRRAAMEEGVKQRRALEAYLKEVLSSAYPHIPWTYREGQAHAEIEGRTPEGFPGRKAPYLVIDVYKCYPSQHLWGCSIVILGMTTSIVSNPNLLTTIQRSLEDAKALLSNLLDVVPHATPLQ